MKLYSALYRRSYLHAFTILHNHHDAQDAASTAWVELYNRWPDNVENSAAVVLRRVSMRCLDTLRRTARQPVDDADAAQSNDGGPAALDSGDLMARTDLVVLIDCLKKLEPEDLRAIWLSRAEGETDIEVGRRLNRHRTTVASRAQNTLAALRECVEGVAP
ncbi:MAG: sigma-70 family RNA polymerase sigma factor [Acidimicrobiales bacterium]|nr:sigma-70 family RNA polymerase sigma factor [Acidimicrobiales bacterium]